MRFLIYAAGSVGGVLGGFLALQGHDVHLICRQHHVDAIERQDGLRLTTSRGETLASVHASSRVTDSLVFDDTIVIITARSNDTDACVGALAKVSPTSTPVVCMQNGVFNEDIVARRFERVIGGVCRMTCRILESGHVACNSPGRIIMGRHPRGLDPVIVPLCDALRDAGFNASASTAIVGDKWLKLVVNLRNSLFAMIEEKDFESWEFTALGVGLMREARAVMDSEGIDARSGDPEVPSVAELIELISLPRPRRSLRSRIRDATRRTPPTVAPVQNSTWQQLNSGQGQLESDHFHGPVIDLGRKHGVPVPFNETVLERITACHGERAGTHSLRAADILCAVRAR